jgi:carboxypeptidase PM20D1
MVQGFSGRMAAALLISISCAAVPAYAQSKQPVTELDRTMARSLLENAIATPTAKGRGQTPVLADQFTKTLLDAGFSSNDIEKISVDIDGEPAVGFVVRYAGRNPKLKPIALLGHMDVVDAIKENWATDPYVPTEKDGYLYGRGASDNKAGITAVVATFARLKRAGFVPERDLVIAFSGDEESGMRTTRALTKHPLVSRAEYALNADAGGGSLNADGTYTFSIQSAEKTYANFAITATNAGGHSSVPMPENAIYQLAAALKKIEAIRFPVEFNEITRIMVTDLAEAEGGEFAAAAKALLANSNDAAARAIVEKYPAKSNIFWTTCVATMLQAGNAPNALPQNATATVNCRIFPGTTIASVQAKIADAIGNPNIKVMQDGEGVESPVSPVNPKIFASLQNATRIHYPGVVLKPSMSSGGTDGREFRSAGIPTYGAGSIVSKSGDSRAHGTDERVQIDSFYKQLEFWDALLRDVGGGKK